MESSADISLDKAPFQSSAFRRISTYEFKNTCPVKSQMPVYRNGDAELKEKSYRIHNNIERLFRQQYPYHFYQQQQQLLTRIQLQMIANRSVPWTNCFSIEPLPEPLFPYPLRIHSFSPVSKWLKAGFIISGYNNLNNTAPHYILPHWKLESAIAENCTAINSKLSNMDANAANNMSAAFEMQRLWPAIFVKQILRKPEDQTSSNSSTFEMNHPDSSDDADEWTNMNRSYQSKQQTCLPVVTSFNQKIRLSHNDDTRIGGNNSGAKIGFNSINQICSNSGAKMKFNSKAHSAVKRPVVRRSRPPRYYCQRCGYSTDRRNNLQRHVTSMHLRTERILECCGLTFHNKALLRGHVLERHVTGYACAVCHRTFRRKALYTRHMSVHSGKKHYACAGCDYATSHKSNLIRHGRVHNVVVCTTPAITEETSAVEEENTLDHHWAPCLDHSSDMDDHVMQGSLKVISNDERSMSNEVGAKSHNEDTQSFLKSFLQPDPPSFIEEKNSELMNEDDLIRESVIQSTKVKLISDQNHSNFASVTDYASASTMENASVTNYASVKDHVDNFHDEKKIIEECGTHFNIFGSKTKNENEAAFEEDQQIDVLL